MPQVQAQKQKEQTRQVQRVEQVLQVRQAQQVQLLQQTQQKCLQDSLQNCSDDNTPLTGYPVVDLQQQDPKILKVTHGNYTLEIVIQVLV